MYSENGEFRVIEAASYTDLAWELEQARIAGFTHLGNLVMVANIQWPGSTQYVVITQRPSTSAEEWMREALRGM